MRISLDQLHTRNKEQVFINACFSVQQRFVVDNTNPTKEERSKYIAAAKAHKYKVIGYYFKTNIHDAIHRNSKRIGKENIREVGIRATNNKLEPPAFSEGFDEVYFVDMDGDGFEVVGLKR
jgi:predicted kinase